MYALRAAVLAALASMVLNAEDFKLKYFALGPISVHTSLSYQGKGERLVASAVNDTGQTVQYLKLCVLGAAPGCLFEMWITEPLEPGKSVAWDVATSKKVANLAHEVTITALNQLQSSSPEQSSTPAAFSTPQEALDNDIIRSLTKAGLGDELILRMINNQPGKYARSPSDVIALKDAGVSDKVISAILDRHSAAPGDSPVRQARIEQNARLFIPKMASNLDAFISAEIVKQNLSFKVVGYEGDAEYILTGLSQRTAVAWYDVLAGSVVGGNDRMEASATLLRVKDKSLVWAGEAGDRSLLFGSFKRGGERKLAERIVRDMKRDLF
jgi:hypothetical protein